MHQVKIRSEYSPGQPIREHRIFCSCGWEEKASTYPEAKRRRDRHREFPQQDQPEEG